MNDDERKIYEMKPDERERERRNAERLLTEHGAYAGLIILAGLVGEVIAIVGWLLSIGIRWFDILFVIAGVVLAIGWLAAVGIAQKRKALAKGRRP